MMISRWIDAWLRAVAHFFSWTLLALVFVVCLDVVTRKIGWQVPALGSTRLQELEWHLQAILFCAWIGYAYTRDAHIRVDVLTSGLSHRTKCKIEIAGCLLLALPYLLVALPYAHQFMMVSFHQGEGSPNSTGLPYRWIVKAALYAAFWGLMLANISVLLKNVALLRTGDTATRETADA
ncbi:MAG: TRAP transporter small permease subunit [Flavobacteriaceae bacterium]